MKAKQNWSKWMKFDKENLKNIPEKSGVYKIRCHKGINRLLGRDEDGILSIGQSKNLKRRIKQFLISVKNTKSNSDQHSEGHRFYRLCLEKYFPTERFEFRFKIDKDVKKVESKLLEKYQWKYGELPPLNSSGGL